MTDLALSILEWLVLVALLASEAVLLIRRPLPSDRISHRQPVPSGELQ